MRVILLWTYLPRGRASSDLRLTRFKRVLLAAQQAPRYQSLLIEIGLSTPEAVSSVVSVEHVLRRLSPIDLEEFRGTLAEFESARGMRPVLESFSAPFSRTHQTAKTAMLHPGFAPAPGVKVLKGPWPEELGHFAATALAAPVKLLREIASAVERGYDQMHPLEHFIVPFTGYQAGELTDEDREQFWRVFQVPVFEQRLGFDGRVIAHECEVHQGLHITGDRALFELHTDSELLLTPLPAPELGMGTQATGSNQDDCCECGNFEPRLLFSRPRLATVSASNAAA